MEVSWTLTLFEFTGVSRTVPTRLRKLWRSQESGEKGFCQLRSALGYPEPKEKETNEAEKKRGARQRRGPWKSPFSTISGYWV